MSPIVHRSNDWNCALKSGVEKIIKPDTPQILQTAEVMKL